MTAINELIDGLENLLHELDSFAELYECNSQTHQSFVGKKQGLKLALRLAQEIKVGQL